MMPNNAGLEGLRTGPMEQLLQAQEQPLLKYTLERVKNRDRAQEIVHESFVRLNAQFNQIPNPLQWLYQTAHDLAAERSAADLISTGRTDSQP